MSTLCSDLKVFRANEKDLRRPRFANSGAKLTQTLTEYPLERRVSTTPWCKDLTSSMTRVNNCAEYSARRVFNVYVIVIIFGSF